VGAVSSAPVSRRRDEDPPPERFNRILLASEGRAIPESAIARVMELTYRNESSVRVLSIARVHGVAFGLPNPGLLPTKHEWDEQREMVRKVVKRFKREGIEADGHVVGTRNATKLILAEATMSECEAIVMAADPPRNRVVADTMWSQEPQRVRRKASLPVYLVVGE
jgi:nucleotide-binding universal stress UspA family protein